MTDTDGSISDYYRLSQLTDVEVGPHGERVAYVVDEFDAEADERLSTLFVMPSDGSASPHRLSRTSSASDPKWGPDGKRLAFIGARRRDTALRAENDDPDEASESDDDPESQVWLFDLDRGGDARQVTSFDEGVEQFDWGPDGERLVAAARDPTSEQRDRLADRADGGPIKVERLQHKYDGEGWLDDVTTYLFVVDVESRETRRLDDAYGAGAREPATGLAPAWSPSGDRIAFLSNRTERPDDSNVVDVFTICPDGSGVDRLTDENLSAGSGTWSPNGRYYAFSGSDPDDAYDPMRVFVIDTEEGAVRSLSSSLDRPLGYGSPFEWVDDERLLGLVGDEGRTRLVQFSVEAPPAKRVYDAQDELRDLSTFDVGGGTVALGVGGPHESPNVHAISVDGVLEDSPDDLVRLTRLNDDLLLEYEPPETRWLEFESGGTPIEGLVYFPADYDPESGSAPLITTIHGGPISYDSPAFNFDYTFWTNRGYALLRVNYRGSSSYGYDFSRAIEGDWGHWEPADVIAGIETVTERGWVNPDRVFVTGFSYGGAQTAYILSQSDVATAGAAEHGVYDRHSYFGTGDSHNRMERDFGLPWEHPETYENISSITDVGEIEAPLLVTAGGEDWRCPPTQSEQLYVSVSKRGVPSRLVVYPDEHHNIGTPDRAVDRLTELTEWFEAHDPANR